VVTSDTFSLDDGIWEVDNNVWVLGDDELCVVVDAAHDDSPSWPADRQRIASKAGRLPGR
jgi:glyoxylase-like metal-dependent hydrolase (beta-lactamase superfamily II)